MSISDRRRPLCLDSAIDIVVMGGGVKHWEQKHEQLRFGFRDPVHVVHMVQLCRQPIFWVLHWISLVKHKHVEYQVDNKVWLLSSNINIQHLSTKLDWKRFGPYPIIEKIDIQAYRL
jgi:hypothetical protein